MKRAIALAGTVFLAAVTGCGAAAAGQATTASPNTRACQHFQIQGKKFKALAAPTMADVAQAVAWVQEDAALATGPGLRRDFQRWVTSAGQVMNGHTPAGNPKTAIVAACARYGVTITR